MPEDKQLKMVCVYCNHEWSPEMEVELTSYSEGCDTCGYGSSATVSIEIRCEKCGRVVYKNDGVKAKYD